MASRAHHSGQAATQRRFKSSLAWSLLHKKQPLGSNDDLCCKEFDRSLLLGICELTIIAKGFDATWNSDLVGKNERPDPREDDPKGCQSPKTAKSPRRGAHQARNLLAER